MEQGKAKSILKREGEKKMYNVIAPACAERVNPVLHYLGRVYASYLANEHSTYYFHNATFDSVSKANWFAGDQLKSFLIFVASETQIEQAVSIYHFLSKTYKDVQFFGDTNLLTKYGLPAIDISEDALILGMKIQSVFMTLGDKDKIEPRKIYPDTLTEVCDGVILGNPDNKFVFNFEPFHPIVTSITLQNPYTDCKYNVSLTPEDILRSILNFIVNETRCIRIVDDDFLADSVRAIRTLHYAWVVNPYFKIVFNTNVDSFLKLTQKYSLSNERSIIHCIVVNFNYDDIVSKYYLIKDILKDWKDIVVFKAETFDPKESLSKLKEIGSFLMFANEGHTFVKGSKHLQYFGDFYKRKDNAEELLHGVREQIKTFFTPDAISHSLFEQQFTLNEDIDFDASCKQVKEALQEIYGIRIPEVCKNLSKGKTYSIKSLVGDDAELEQMNIIMSIALMAFEGMLSIKEGN